MLETGVSPRPAKPRVKIPRYAAALDFEALWLEFPPADEYFAGAYLRSAEEIRTIQNERFLRQMARAWQIPFYRKHWSAVGMSPGDIRGLDDLERIRRSRCTTFAVAWSKRCSGPTISASIPTRTSRCR